MVIFTADYDVYATDSEVITATLRNVADTNKRISMGELFFIVKEVGDNWRNRAGISFSTHKILKVNLP
jgi:hypothetical protein